MIYNFKIGKPCIDRATNDYFWIVSQIESIGESDEQLEFAAETAAREEIGCNICGKPRFSCGCSFLDQIS